MDRNLDGIYIRVKRNGKYEPVCLSDCEEEALINWLKGLEKEALVRVAVQLANTIKKIGDELDIVRQFGLET